MPPIDFRQVVITLCYGPSSGQEKEFRLYTILTGDDRSTSSPPPSGFTEFQFLMPKPWWKFWASRKKIVIMARSTRELSIIEILPFNQGSTMLDGDPKIEVIDYLLGTLNYSADIKAIETSMARFV